MKDNSNIAPSVLNALKIIVKSMVNREDVSSTEFLRTAFEATFQLIPEAEKGSLYLLEEDTYFPMCSKGYDIELLKKLSFTKDSIFIGFEEAEADKIIAYETFIEQREPNKFTEETIETFKALGTYSNFVTLYAPIVYKSQPVGLISLEKFTEHAFPEHSKEIMKIYAQMISNYFSISKQKEFEQQLFNETVEALVSAIEIKDTYTEGHGKRVRDLTAKICKSLSLPMEDQKKICLAALLHDIGKIGIPTEILNKPDRLTGEEYEIVKAHPEKATHVLSKIGSFTEILDIVKHHHEYHNGQGYPSGLSGSNIPLGSRIILIADAYDAMTSKRAYRESMSIDEAKAELSRNAGSQFNPELVNQVLSVLA